MKLKTTAKRLPEHTDAPLKERHVNMSNALARSAQGMNLTQKRIIALALATTDSKPAQHLLEGQRNGWLININAADYAETYELDANTAYEQLKDGATSLLKTLWTTVKTGHRGPVITKGQWLSLAHYHEGQGRVEIIFHPIIAPHLLGLRTQFITYKLKRVAALRSVYAWRLFECLESWKTTGQWQVDLEDFHRIMEAPPSYAKDYGNIKKYVLTPAINELRTKQNLIIECTEKRAGRKVIALEFRFHPDPQTTLDI